MKVLATLLALAVFVNQTSDGKVSERNPAGAVTPVAQTSSIPPILAEIRYCESTHRYQVQNDTSSASGAYQFLKGTWEDAGFDQKYGVPEAYMATPAQQDEAAKIHYGNHGTTPWNASKACWG